MKRSLAVPLYVLMVFLSGTLVGAVGYRLYSAKTVTATVAPKPKPEEWRKHVVDDMRTRLKLSDEQVGKLQAAFDAPGSNSPLTISAARRSESHHRGAAPDDPLVPE